MSQDVEWGAERPKTFGECQGRPMPCPWVGCKYHALLDVIASGAIAVNSGMQLVEGASRRRPKQASRRLPVWRNSRQTQKGRAEDDDRRSDEIVDMLMEVKHTCVLHMVANGRSYTLDAVGGLLNVTRERVRQIEVKALCKLGEVDEEVLREMLLSAIEQRERGEQWERPITGV